MMDAQHDKLTIETPEMIPLEFPLAGVGSRFLAVALDSLIQFVVGMSLVILGMLIVLPHGGSPRKGIWVAAVGVIAYFLLQFGYFTFFECLWNGQTPGKRRFHLRVIKESGRPITVYDAVVRNLMRMVDSMPGFYGIGILAALLSSHNQRLGDFVAGTVVVHEEPLASQAPGDWTPQAPAVPFAYDVSQLAPEEFQLLETFLMRREQLAPPVRAQMARRAALRLGVKLGIPAEDRQNAEALLERLAQEYRRRMQFR
jgi:uncharacterized RDD family membrane protein YckC